jgi:hypothetical protein
MVSRTVQPQRQGSEDTKLIQTLLECLQDELFGMATFGCEHADDLIRCSAHVVDVLGEAVLHINTPNRCGSGMIEPASSM